LASAGGALTLTGDEARHAVRVKRLRVGDEALALDGAGLVADARVTEAGRSLVLDIGPVRRLDPPSPAVEVWSATPKGPRLATLVDLLSEVGAGAWTPMRTERANIHPSAARRDRLGRVAVEAMKQCRRGWMLTLGEPSDLADALNVGAEVVIADPAGDPYRRVGADRVRLLVGPEGGFTAAELGRARDAGARVCRFGPHVMRIEIAAAVACAIILDAERRQPG